MFISLVLLAMAVYDLDWDLSDRHDTAPAERKPTEYHEGAYQEGAAPLAAWYTASLTSSRSLHTCTYMYIHDCDISAGVLSL